MAKTYTLDRSGAQPQLKEAEAHNKMKVFKKSTDIDLSELAENEIVATEGDSDLINIYVGTEDEVDGAIADGTITNGMLYGITDDYTSTSNIEEIKAQVEANTEDIATNKEAIDASLPTLSALDTSSSKAINSTAIVPIQTQLSKAIICDDSSTTGACGTSADNMYINVFYKAGSYWNSFNIMPGRIDYNTTKSGTWQTAGQFYAMKSMEITNKAITISSTGCVHANDFTGLSNAWSFKYLKFVCTSFSSNFGETDAWIDVRTSKYGNHFVFSKIPDLTPLSGNATISGVVYYIE